MSKIALIFPDYAACFIGMGEGLADGPPASAAVYQRAADVLGYSVADVCRNGPDAEITRASRIHTAVVTTSLACLAGLQAAGLEAAAVAGHSLGEISAAVAAGALSGPDALRLAAHQGALLEALEARAPGSMVAVLGIDPQDVEDACAQVGGQVFVAQINSPMHVVIAGHPDAVRQAAEASVAVGAERVIPLSVHEAWHTPLMASVAADMVEMVRGLDVQPPKIPFVSGASGKVMRTADDVRDSLGTLIQSPVRWHDAMETLMSEHMEYVIEVGGRTKMGGMERFIKKHMRPLAVYDRETLNRVVGQLAQQAPA